MAHSGVQFFIQPESLFVKGVGGFCSTLGKKKNYDSRDALGNVLPQSKEPAAAAGRIKAGMARDRAVGGRAHAERRSGRREGALWRLRQSGCVARGVAFVLGKGWTKGAFSR